MTLLNDGKKVVKVLKIGFSMILNLRDISKRYRICYKCFNNIFKI